jgi:lysozyme family protein
VSINWNDLADHLEAIAKLLRDDGGFAPSAPTPTPIPDTPAPQPQVPPEYNDYLQKWVVAVVNPDRTAEVQGIAQRIQQNAARYQQVATAVGLTYWPLVGIVHNLESGMDFTTHLHNGDPLTDRTVHVPAGRPLGGSPPFTWEESAIDALREDQHWDRWTDWSIPGMAYRLERYNGLGYRNHGVPSPYLWAGSDQYVKGRYVADGQFDPESVSQQIGGMTVLKYLDTVVRVA